MKIAKFPHCGIKKVKIPNQAASSVIISFFSNSGLISLEIIGVVIQFRENAALEKIPKFKKISALVQTLKFFLEMQVVPQPQVLQQQHLQAQVRPHPPQQGLRRRRQVCRHLQRPQVAETEIIATQLVFGQTYPAWTIGVT